MEKGTITKHTAFTQEPFINLGNTETSGKNSRSNGIGFVKLDKPPKGCAQPDGSTETGNGTTGYVQHILSLSGQDPAAAREVLVAPLPAPVKRRIQRRVAYKACYHNAELAIRANKGGLYVLGYWQHLIPVEHAWVRFGDTYHDPTSEILFQREGLFVSVVELELPQVQEIRRALGTRDYLDLYGYFRWLSLERRKAA